MQTISAWSDRWDILPNINQYHILQMGTKIHNYEYETSRIKFEKVQCVIYVSVTIMTNLKFSKHCKDATGKANRMLDFNTHNFRWKKKKIILPLYIHFVRLHLEFPAQFWCPHIAKNIKIIGTIQRRATKMIPSMRNKYNEVGLTLLNMFHLE